jgi:hypothetical protein
MITAQCFLCKESFQVPSTWSCHYVMINQVPCRDCFHKIINDEVEE